MSAFATLDRVSAVTPDGRTLFDNLSLAFGAERVGVVGRNGAGKTTLLRLLAGEVAPSAGAISRGGRLGVLRQHLAISPGDTVADALGVAEELSRLRRIEEGLGSEEDLSEADWLLPSRLDGVLEEVGLTAGLERLADTLSGGERTRLAMAALLVQEPDLILLDEPTNNLDAEARAAVARLLEGWRKGAVVVSHDRDLLRQVDRVLELSSLGPRLYGGDYDLYAERKAEERAAAERGLDAAERELRRVERESQRAREKKARRDSAGRRFAAKRSEPKILLGAQKERAELSGAREGRIADRLREEAADGLDAARERVEQVRLLGFELPSTGLPAGRAVLAFEEAGWAVDGRAVLPPRSFALNGPERVAVSGPNGAGKSTLLKLAAGALHPTQGRVLRPVTAALLDQHVQLLTSGQSLVDNFRRLNPGGSENQARAALARFLFRAEAGLRTPETLSGGERLRAALACVLGGGSPPQLLLLDEPSNHLDLDSLQAVERALAAYDGALLVVSHDRDFLAAVGVEREIALGG